MTPEQIAAIVTRHVTISTDKMNIARAALPEAIASRLPSAEQIATAVKSGRTGKLLTSKPAKENGAVRFAWRWCRFHSGTDTTFPTTCDFDLADWLREIDPDVNPYASAVRRHAADYLIEAASVAVIALGLNPLRGTMRWGRALGMI
jgi:hypothetical protein